LARDHHGDVVAAIVGRTENVVDAFYAEVCAVGQAIRLIRLAESLGTIHIVLETDSELLMLALNRRGTDLSPVGVAIDDSKHCCVLRFHLMMWFLVNVILIDLHMS
jgi:hypothetical protein